jgi:hypothetical protein
VTGGEDAVKPRPITRRRIDELLRYLPVFAVPDARFVTEWGGGPRPDGTIEMGYPVYASEVSAFFELAAQPCWCDYEYHPATVGEMLEDDALIAAADLDGIRTMLTYCVRGERFGGGHWEEMLVSGVVVKLLRRLEQLRETVKR